MSSLSRTHFLAELTESAHGMVHSIAGEMAVPGAELLRRLNGTVTGLTATKDVPLGVSKDVTIIMWRALNMILPKWMGNDAIVGNLNSASLRLRASEARKHNLSIRSNPIHLCKPMKCSDGTPTPSISC